MFAGVSLLALFTGLARALPPEPAFDVAVPLKPENASLGYFPYDLPRFSR